MKKMIRILSLSTALSCLLLAGCSKTKDSEAKGSTKATDASPVEMKLKWTVGKRYVQEMTLSQSGELTMPGSTKPMQQQTEITNGYSLSALKQRPEGGTEVKLQFTGQKISSKLDGREMLSFDSNADPAQEASNPAASLFRRVVGAHATAPCSLILEP